MRFIYALTGWEGSAADARVLRDAIHRHNGSKVPTGSYYLCDNGYGNVQGFLTPYRKVRYRRDAWGNGANGPQNYKEFFDAKHSSARNKCLMTLYKKLMMLALVTLIKMKMDLSTMLTHLQLGTCGMEFGRISNGLHGNEKKSDRNRRVWSAREEECLIQSLKEAVSSGWKSENGFRCGYLGFLERAMKKVFTDTDLRANPHINSKIHVWKKTHGTLLSKSGVGWNETEKILEVTDEVWESIVKVDNSVRNMRSKSWTYYQDWYEIFGQDRATGEHVETFADAVQDVLNMGNNDDVSVEVEVDTILGGFDGNGDSMSVATPTFSNASSVKKTIGKKRKKQR